MDNKIVTYEAGNTFRFIGHKKFTGHLSSGYACEVGFSPDNQYLMSGDGHGKLYLWSFRNQRLLKTLNAHTEPLMSCVWHPRHTSKVLTAGYDGTVKLWD